MFKYISMIVLFCLASVSALAQSNTKLPVPDEAAVQNATKELAKLYKKENDAAKLAPQKSELARKMVADALNTTNDPVAKYTLLSIARRLALQSGDVSMIIRATEGTINEFAVSRSTLMIEVLKEANKKIDSPEDNFFVRRWLEYALSFPSDSPENTKRLIDMGVAFAKEAKDKEALEEWLRRLKEFKERTEALDALVIVHEKLEATPLDPVANEKLGRHLAFIEHNWEIGIPVLALGENPKLAALAERDLRQPTSAQDRLALGKDWITWGDTQTDAAKLAASARGAFWYRLVLPTLTGLEKTRVEKELAALDALSSPFANGRWVELLDRVDISRHGLTSTWNRESFSVQSPETPGWQLLDLPIAIEGGSYEVQLRLTNFKNDVVVFFPGPEHPVGISISCWDNITAFSRIDGREGREFKEAVGGLKFEPQQTYTFTIRVERSGGQAAYSFAINGKKVTAFQGRESSLSSGYPQYSDKLFFGSNHARNSSQRSHPPSG